MTDERIPNFVVRQQEPYPALPVSALRHMAPPVTNVIEYKRGSEVSDLELAIREFIPQSHIKLSLQG